MNCDQVCRLMAAGRPLPQEAVNHLRTCPICSELDAIGQTAEDWGVDPTTEHRIIAAITSDLQPVRPLAPPWSYALAFMGASAVVAASGVWVLGSAGWRADTILHRAYFTTCLTGAIAVSAAMLSRLMVPAAFLPATPRPLVVLFSVLLGAGALLYPVAHYDHFVRAAATCLFLGLSHAVVQAALAFWIVRRAAFRSSLQMLVMIALIGGLTGVVVLYVFCPHRDLGHFAIAHSTVPMVAAALGAWTARRVRS